MYSAESSQRHTHKPLRENSLVFGLCWLLVFLLYIPAAKAGFVVDFTGWLDQVKNQSFPDYINRTHFSVKSLYQFTQFASWLFYKLFGTNPWAWHLLFITLQALNATLLYRFILHLTALANVSNGIFAAIPAVVLFCICPHISEVVVWEPSFHYLLGLLMILSILILLQKWLDSHKRLFLFAAIGIYLLSTFSLEYFYLTPFLVLTYILFRGKLVGSRSRKAVLYVFVPMLGIMALRTVLFRLIYSGWVSRTGDTAFSDSLFSYAVKPVKYIFHLVFFGRFWTEEHRQKVYALCESPAVVGSFYFLFAGLAILYFMSFRRLNGRLKLAGLFLLWTAFAIALVSPMWFPEHMLVSMDRYAYLALAFGFVFLALVLTALPRTVALILLSVYAIINIGYTIQVNHYWQQSEKINSTLINSFPDPGNRITLLLNLPEMFNGIPMIGAGDHGEFKLIHNLLSGRRVNTPVYDLASFNLTSYWNGANAIVVNDSTVKVTLNQWGTWWWRNGQGATDFENEDYKLYMRDVGHWYDVVLKKPAENYLLLYLSEGQWKQVDMSKKIEVQD